MKGTSKENLIVINYHIHTKTPGKRKNSKVILEDFRRVSVQASMKCLRIKNCLK